MMKWRVHDHGDKRHHEFAVMADVGGVDGSGGKVASVLAGRGTHFTWKDAEKHARLIGAAPDLLAFASLIARMVKYDSEYPVDIDRDDAATALNKLIDRARDVTNKVAVP